MNLLSQFRDYLLSQKNPSSKATVKNYLSDLHKFMEWFNTTFHSDFKADMVTKETIEYFKKSNPHLSATSLERHISSIRKFFNFLKLEGLIESNPLEIGNLKLEIDKDPWHLKEFKDYLYVYNASRLTIKNYSLDIKNFLSWADKVTADTSEWNIKEKNLLGKINNRLIETYKTRLLGSANEAGLSPATVNRKLSALRKFTAWAKEKGYISEEYQVASIKYQVSKLKKIPNTKYKIHNTPPEYSVFPPFRLFQKSMLGVSLLSAAILINPTASVVKNLEQLLWKAKGKPLFKTRVKREIPVTNIKKELYAPLLVSTTHFPIHKKVLFHLRHNRPKWYKAYHSYPLTTYLHMAILVLFMSVIGFGIYQDLQGNLPASRQVLGIDNPKSPPRIFSFQGRLTDVSDKPITAQTSLRFGIYNALTGTGSALMWQEVNTVTPDSEGIFSVLLGTVSTMQQSMFAEHAGLWLGVTVGQTPELTPRQQLATVAYAQNAETLQGLPPITDSSGGTKNVVLALNSSGNLVIGGSATPSFQATGGKFTLSGNVLALTTVSGTNSNIQIVPDGTGIIDLQKPLQNSTNNNNISTAVGAVEVNDLFAVLATSSGQSAFTVNQNDTGPIISASSSGTAKFTVDNSGNTTIAGNFLPTLTANKDLGSSSVRWNNLWVQTINTTGTNTSGQSSFTYDPLDTTITQSSVLINPTSAGPNEALLGLAIGGSERARIDTEGDLALGFAGGTLTPNANPLTVYNHGTTQVASIDTSGNTYLEGTLGVGISSGILGKVNIQSADSGVTSASANADELVIEGSGNSGISILTPNTATGSIRFGDPQDNGAGEISYDHSTNKMSFTINGSTRWNIDSSGNLLANGDNNYDIGASGATRPRTGYFGTSIVDPLLIGGSATTSTLTLRSTSGVGASGADIIFQTGNNGATEAMRISNAGNVGIGTTTPAQTLDVNGTFAVSKTTSFSATGGTVTTSGGYTIHTFTTSGTFTASGTGDVEYLVVGGGGAGGGGSIGGGGGAGGMRTGTRSALSTGSYSITVGAGGVGQGANGVGNDGGNSVFDTITSTGGGGGGNYSDFDGRAGGSGGGAGSSEPATLPVNGGAGTSGQGNAGGNTTTQNNYSAAGGGGAGAAGTNAGANSGAGGTGSASSISGSSVTYAGGGGGAADSGPVAGAGGTGGGGAGGASRGSTGGSGSVNGAAGTANTGGGGGGGGVAGAGGNGGSGIVILKYLNPINYSIHTTVAGNVGIGTTSPDSKAQITGGGLCVGSDTNCNTDNNTEGVIYSSSTAMTVYDVAENYPTKDATLVPGEVVTLDPDNGVFVKRSENGYDSLALGAISEKPGVLLGGFNGQQFKEERQVAVALSGRIDIKITNENGNIKIGDHLTSSATRAGYAMKATRAGRIVGVALEDFVATACDLGDFGLVNPSNCTGKILVFVNPGYYDPNPAIITTIEKAKDYIIEKAKSEAELVASGVYVVKNALDKTAAQTQILASAVIGTLRVGLIEAKDIVTDNLVINNKAISPIAEVNIVRTNTIAPLTADKIVIKPNETSASSSAVVKPILEIQNSSGSAVATIDTAGNASFSGTLNSFGLISKEASISGTLRTKNLVAENIDTAILNLKSSILNLTEQTASDSASPVDIASYSAQFANVDTLNAVVGSFSGGLFAVGPTSLSDATVFGQLSIGTTLTLADNSINVLGTDLQIQSLGLGGVSFLAGKVAIDVNGNLDVSGNATIRGTLFTNVLSPIPGSDLIVRLASGSASPSFVIKNASGSAVAKVNAEGDATFRKLNLSLIEKAFALNDNEILATGSAGIATISAHLKEITVHNKLVTENSLIYISPVGTPSAQIPFLIRQVPETSFTVGTQDVGGIELPFNWLIIN